LLGEKGWRLMTTTLNGVTKKKADEQSAEQVAAVELIRAARAQGLSLTGPDGLLKQFTKTVLETSLIEEMPPDRTGTFEPQIVRKRQRRLNGVDEVVLSLYAKGLTAIVPTQNRAGPPRPPILPIVAAIALNPLHRLGAALQ
jgi:putative transposase